jgi:hypothetical protein
MKILSIALLAFNLLYADIVPPLEAGVCVKTLLKEENNEKKIERLRNDMVKAYTEVAQKNQITPNEDYMLQIAKEHGIQDPERLFGKNKIFENFDELKKLAYSKNTKAFKFVIDGDIFNQAREDRFIKMLRTKRRYVLVTAIAGSPVNADFFQTLLNYCAKNDAEIIVYAANMEVSELPKELIYHPKVHILINSMKLTPWLTANRIKLIAKQINPLMGLERIGNRGESQIVGSPKMHFRTVPTLDNQFHPHQLLTTGAITDPNYAGAKYIQGRTDEIATHDHVMGAVILEKSFPNSQYLKLESPGMFHIRHIEYIPEHKRFMDLDKYYYADRVEKSNIKVLTAGDIHVGVQDEKLFPSVIDLITRLNPEVIDAHDLLNAHSINPHELQKLLTLAQKSEAGKLSLEKEFDRVVHFLNALLARNKKLTIRVIPSNHDLWLPNKYLQSGQFMNEPQNMRFGIELAKAMIEGKNPLEYGLIARGLEYPERVVFLNVGSSLKTGPVHRQVEHASHGHAGANGGKPSKTQYRQSYDRVVYGHTHTYERYNGVVNIGTFTELIQNYNKDGVSNWVQGLSLTGEDGQIQVLQFKDGEWCSTIPKSERIDADKFFYPGFPKVVPNAQGGAGQVDQYSGH